MAKLLVVFLFSLNKHFNTYLGPVLPPGTNVIELFTVVIYCHSMLTLSYCVIKLFYYLGSYYGMAVNYHGILTLKSRAITSVIYRSIVL